MCRIQVFSTAIVYDSQELKSHYDERRSGNVTSFWQLFNLSHIARSRFPTSVKRRLALWFFTSLLLMDSPANRSRVGVTADEGWCRTSFSWTKLCYCWFWLRYCELPLSRVRTVRLHWVLSVTLSSVRLMNMSHVVKRRVSVAVFLAWNVPIWIKHCSVWPPVFSQLLSLWQICDHKAW